MLKRAKVWSAIAEDVRALPERQGAVGKVIPADLKRMLFETAASKPEWTAAHCAAVLAVYSAGLGIPFLLTALAFSKMTTAFAVIKRHYAAIMAVAGGVLIVMGVLILTGDFFQLNIQAQKLTNDLGLNP